jgi:hypothetical protein
MFGTIGQVSAPASTVRVREIKTFGWAVGWGGNQNGAAGNQNRAEIKTDTIPAGSPIERQVIPSGRCINVRCLDIDRVAAAEGSRDSGKPASRATL